jgi:3-oxoacyl-[acyl-carrier protein] reductase
MQKTALVTGGNKGIGLAVTRALLAHDLKVIIVARSFSDFPLSDHPSVQTICFDLTCVEEIPALIATIGGVDVLINNAGVLLGHTHDQYAQADIDRVVRLNLTAPIALITAVAPHMTAQRCGRVVNVASIAGQIGHPDVWYGATKAGILNATKSFSKLLGPDGVLVNAVAPGPVETDMLNAIPEARKAAVQKATISGRFAQPSEIADTIAWLATSSPTYLNGACIDINDGAVLR